MAFYSHVSIVLFMTFKNILNPNHTSHIFVYISPSAAPKLKQEL